MNFERVVGCDGWGGMGFEDEGGDDPEGSTGPADCLLTEGDQLYIGLFVKGLTKNKSGFSSALAFVIVPSARTTSTSRT